MLHDDGVGVGFANGHAQRTDQRRMTMLERARAKARRRRPAIAALHEAHVQEPVEVGEASRVVQRRLVAQEPDVHRALESAHQLGHAASTAVTRRKHGKRRYEQHGRRIVAALAQTEAV
jgi:hypothetical protein